MVLGLTQKAFALSRSPLAAPKKEISLPNVHDIRASMLINICDEKGDYDKCLEIADRMNNHFGYYNIRWFESIAERISKFGNVRKHEAIAAWRDLEKIARCHHREPIKQRCKALLILCRTV